MTLTDRERADVTVVRVALTLSTDRDACAAFERLVRRWSRSEDDTKETPVPKETP